MRNQDGRSNRIKDRYGVDLERLYEGDAFKMRTMSMNMTGDSKSIQIRLTAIIMTFGVGGWSWNPTFSRNCAYTAQDSCY
jgi:hypothetical protein